MLSGSGIIKRKPSRPEASIVHNPGNDRYRLLKEHPINAVFVKTIRPRDKKKEKTRIRF